MTEDGLFYDLEQGAYQSEAFPLPHKLKNRGAISLSVYMSEVEFGFLRKIFLGY